MGSGKTVAAVLAAVFLGWAAEVPADDGEVIQAWNDALRKGETPGSVDTRHLVEVERDRERLRIQYLDPSRVEKVEDGRLKVTWLLLSGVVMVGEAATARVETEFLCEEGLSRGVAAMVFDVKGGFLRRQELPVEWMEADEAEEVLLRDYCGAGKGVE